MYNNFKSKKNEKSNVNVFKQKRTKVEEISSDNFSSETSFKENTILSDNEGNTNKNKVIVDKTTKPIITKNLSSNEISKPSLVFKKVGDRTTKLSSFKTAENKDIVQVNKNTNKQSLSTKTVDSKATNQSLTLAPQKVDSLTGERCATQKRNIILENSRKIVNKFIKSKTIKTVSFVTVGISSVAAIATVFTTVNDVIVPSPLISPLPNSPPPYIPPSSPLPLTPPPSPWPPRT